MKHLPILLCVAALCSLIGCKPEPVAHDILSGSIEAPVWSAPDNYDYSSSMTAVVKVDLALTYPDQAKDFRHADNDILAAFIGETCLGVATWQEDAAAYWLYMVIPTSMQQADGGMLVTLRFYSEQYKNIFVSKDAFLFSNDTHLGSVSAPFTPAFMPDK